MTLQRQYVHELLLQSLETELCGVEVYESAVECALNDDLRDEWRHFLEDTERHVEVVQSLCEALGVDPDTETPGRAVVRHLGEALVAASRWPGIVERPKEPRSPRPNAWSSPRPRTTRTGS